jgi:hypothetical protein
MKVRVRRLCYKTMYLNGPWGYGRRVLGKHTILQAFDAGHDDHSCLIEYMIARFK